MARPWFVLLALWNTLVYATWIVGPFFAAGTARWPAGWVHLAVWVSISLLHRLYVAKRNPALLAQRRSIGQGTKRWDLAWNALFWPFMASIALVGGWQFRAAGSALPAAVWPLGIGLFAAGMSFSAWAMSTNPHFEGTVRIQTERDHRVVSTGPYRRMRHPGYLGLVLCACASPFLLRSSWALAPAIAAVGWIALRTALEDATLRRELDGYAQYAQRVRHRLVPGLW